MNSEPALSKSTLRGTLLFVLLLTLVFVSPDLWYYFRPVSEAQLSYSDPEFRDAVHSVRRNLAQSRKRFEKRNRYSAPIQAFDPNAYTIEDWMQLGLSEKQAAVVLKFTKYGIYSNEDLRKIFVIPEELYVLIKDSTRYPERPARQWNNDFGKQDEQHAAARKTDLNKATEEDLLKVRGIGPFFARQIIRRREELGGFYSEEQLLEVWKMDAEKLEKMLPDLLIDASHLRRINLNTATAEELKSHPYISWNLANSIVKLRSQNGPYRRVEDVRKSVLMTDELYEKLKRYLTTDP